MSGDEYFERHLSGALRRTAEGVWQIQAADGRVVWTSRDVVPGTPFGRLVVLEAVRPHWLVGIGGGVQPRVRVRCECGKEFETYWNGLRADHGARDCGCGLARLKWLPQSPPCP